MALLQKQPIEVSSVGALVVLRLGNLQYSLEFPVALKLAASLRQHASLAKLIAGDTSHSFQAVGVLTDANAPAVLRQRFAARLPELLGQHALDVTHEGQLVVLKILGTVAKLPYPVARMLSQWLRVRGKEAKNNAGETARHWSEFGDLTTALSGHQVS